MKRYLPRNLVLCFTLVAAFGLLAPHVGLALEGLPREKGAIYLEDFFGQPYRLRVLANAPIFFNSDLARFLGTLNKGELVELQAVNDSQGILRVRGMAHQGQVVGWVEAKYVTALDPNFVVGLRRSIERRRQVQALTANGDVALGMTAEEVSASLGAPLKKMSHTDAQGAAESWEYIRYVTVPKRVNSYDSLGRFSTTVVYEKVPTGKFTVTFGPGGVVAAIDRSEANVAQVVGQAAVQSVPPPITFAERDL